MPDRGQKEKKRKATRENKNQVGIVTEAIKKNIKDCCEMLLRGQLR